MWLIDTIKKPRLIIRLADYIANYCLEIVSVAKV